MNFFAKAGLKITGHDVPDDGANQITFGVEILGEVLKKYISFRCKKFLKNVYFKERNETYQQRPSPGTVISSVRKMVVYIRGSSQRIQVFLKLVQIVSIVPYNLRRKNKVECSK